MKCPPSWLSIKKWLPNYYILNCLPNGYNMTIHTYIKYIL